MTSSLSFGQSAERRALDAMPSADQKGELRMRPALPYDDIQDVKQTQLDIINSQEESSLFFQPSELLRKRQY